MFQFTSCQQKPGMKERRQAKDDRTKLTEELMATVPLLLSKYKMDGDKMASLLIVPRYFDLEQYVTGRFVGQVVCCLCNIFVVWLNFCSFNLRYNITYRKKFERQMYVCQFCFIIIRYSMLLIFILVFKFYWQYLHD